MRFFIFITVLFFSLNLQAQNETSSKSAKDSSFIQISGVVVSADSLTQMSFATIFNRGTKRGTLADYYGYFSIVAKAGDTLIFTYFTHKTSTYIVPDSLKQNRYSIVHMMFAEFKELPEFTVYPWPSREDFARAFVEMETYDDALRRAQKQLSGESLAFAAARLSTDASMTYNWQRAQDQTKLYTHGQLPVNNLFNPASWAKFVSALKKGELGRE